MRLSLPSTPLSRVLTAAALIFFLLFPVAAQAAPLTQTHPPTGCSDSIQHFSDDSGHFSEDISLKAGHVYTLDILGRQPVLPVVAVYRSDATFNLNKKDVPYKTDAGAFLGNSDFPLKGAYADTIKIPEGNDVTAYVSSLQGLSFTIRVCDKGAYTPTSIPPLASPSNPFCGKQWPIHFSSVTHDISDYVIIDRPGSYRISITGNQQEISGWYYGDYHQKAFTLNGKAAKIATDDGGDFFESHSPFPKKSSPDRLTFSEGRLFMQPIMSDYEHDDDFVVTATCIK